MSCKFLKFTTHNAVNFEKNNSVRRYYDKKQQKIFAPHFVPIYSWHIYFSLWWQIHLLDIFFQCSSLTSVSIPDSVTNIGENAFYNVAEITYDTKKMTATGSPWGAKKVNGATP